MRTRLSRDAAGLLFLAVLFGAFVHQSWLAWGHVDADYGREMYVPLRIVQGDVIYRDVRYPYGPFSPYLHALGYAVWKPHLAVLYASGLASVAGILVLLYGIARQFASAGTATLATAFALVEVMAFEGHTASFSYVFPYAFPALHGVLFLLLTLWGCLRAAGSGGERGALEAGIGAGFALIVKQETGATAVVLLLMTAVGLWLAHGGAAVRRSRSALVPALGIPLVVYGALALTMPATDIVSRGLFAETYFGWRLSWLVLGFRPNATWSQIEAVLARGHVEGGLALGALVALVAATSLAFRGGGVATPPGLVSRVSRAAIVGMVALVVVDLLARPAGTALLPWSTFELSHRRYFALPLLALAWLIATCARIAGRLLSGTRPSPSLLQGALASATVVAMLARVPARLAPRDYANFALPLAIVLVVVVVAELVPRVSGRLGGNRRAGRLAAWAVVAALGLSVARERREAFASRTEPLRTARGTLYFHPLEPALAGFRGALARIEAETAPGAPILAVPDGTALYFLSGRETHLYETSLIAVLRTDEEESEYLRQLEADPPHLVLVSDRLQREYGRTEFGADYAVRVDAWIRRRYAPGESFGVYPRFRVWRPREG